MPKPIKLLKDSVIRNFRITATDYTVIPAQAGIHIACGKQPQTWLIGLEGELAKYLKELGYGA